MEDEILLLHETPIIRAFFKRVRCLLKGGHKHIYVGRTFLDRTEEGKKHYSLHYVCTHCQHFRWADEIEE